MKTKITALIAMTATLAFSQLSLASIDDQAVCTIQGTKITAHYSSGSGQVDYVVTTPNQPTQSHVGVVYSLVSHDELATNDDNAKQVTEIGQSMGVDMSKVRSVGIFVLAKSNDAVLALMRYEADNYQTIKTVLMNGWTPAPCE